VRRSQPLTLGDLIVSIADVTDDALERAELLRALLASGRVRRARPAPPLAPTRVPLH